MASVDIGKKLKDARLQKNMSLDELQQITKTQKRYLVAIEENDFDSMPGTFYIRAFIRQYASAVGLDGNELVAIYDGKDKMPEKKDESEEEVVIESRAQMYEAKNNWQKFLNNLPAIIFSLVGLSIAIIVFYVTWQDRNSLPVIEEADREVLSVRSETEESTDTEATDSSTEQSTTESSSTKEESAIIVSYDGEYSGNVLMTAKNLPDTPVKLGFSAKNAACWVGVSIPGQTTTDSYFFQETIQAGQSKVTELPVGTTQIYINLGAAQNMSLTLDGQEVAFNPSQTVTGSRVVGITFDYVTTVETTETSEAPDTTVEPNF